jgi:hypothetical protein
MFAPPPALAVDVAEGIGYRSTGHAMQQAETRPYGALLSFWSGSPGQARLEVRDESDALVWSRSVSAHRGVNRVDWNLRPGGDADEEAFPRSVEVLPGSYGVSVRKDGTLATARLEVRGDPRRPVAIADLVARNDALREVVRLNEQVTEGRERIERTLRALGGVIESLPTDADELRSRGTALRDTLQRTMRELFTGPECQGICGGDTPASRARSLGFSLAGVPGAPGENDRLKLAQARQAAQQVIDEVSRVFADEVAPYREALRAAGYTPLPGPGSPGGPGDV